MDNVEPQLKRVLEECEWLRLENKSLRQKLGMVVEPKAVKTGPLSTDQKISLFRSHQGKSVVQVYDYVDQEVPMLGRMFLRRLRGYKAIGYSLQDESPHNTFETVQKYEPYYKSPPVSQGSGDRF